MAAPAASWGGGGATAVDCAVDAPQPTAVDASDALGADIDELHPSKRRRVEEGVGAQALEAHTLAAETAPRGGPVQLPAAEEPPAILHPPGHPLSLPDGWLHCPPVGELCFGMFVPCKVPLGRRFNEVLPPSARFTPASALAAAASSPRGREGQVVAVVDLTKTKRYYSPEELQDSGAQYIKVPCAGSDGAPSPLEVNTFCIAVLDVLRRWRPRQDKTPQQPVVLVHCTHGFNRTGAMLVHFAMRMTLLPHGPLLPNGWPDLPTALAEFAKARAPGIYKEGYIAELFEYYHEVRPLPPAAQCPPTPPWKHSTEGPPPLRDDDVPPGDLWGMDNEAYMATRAVSDVPLPDEMGAAQREQGGASGGVPRHDDVMGEEVPPLLADQVLSTIRDILRVPPSLAGQEFLGSQPVSLASANAALLADPALHYCVSWKADGTRYMALLLHGGVYLVDRAARVRRCQMRFPAPPPPGRPPSKRADKPDYGTQYAVLLDGEMVADALEPGGPPAQLRFLIYDCMSLSLGMRGSQEPPFADLPFMNRYEAIEAAVVAPKIAYEKAAARRYRTAAEPFRVWRKRFDGPERAAWLLQEFIPKKLTHFADGLIFQPGAEPYKPRTNEHLLKWKLPSLNSVDFYVHAGEAGEAVLCVTGSDGALKALSGVALPPALLSADEPSPLDAPLVFDAAEEGQSDLLHDGCIAECAWDGARGAWSLLRVRQDKQHPNHESVFARVWQSIRDNLREEDVLRLLEPAVAARKAKHEEQPQKRGQE